MNVVRAVDPVRNEELTDLLLADPVARCFPHSRIIDRNQGRGASHSVEVWGFFPRGGELSSALMLGANLIPIGTDEAAREEFVRRLVYSGRRCSSIVGPAEEVLPLWRLLRQSWGPARDVRADQPLLATESIGPIRPDPLVRLARIDELDLLLPSFAAMFTEEVGIDPMVASTAELFRARVADMIRRSRALVRVDGDEVVFKADFGALTPQAVQIQGVWVPPHLRRQGIGGRGMAAVVAAALAKAPIASLYVNDYNTAARRTYEQVGFQQVGSFATVLF